MPPNRFESEVESFLEGSHGDRTHIKRADHPRLHHYAGRYSVTFVARSLCVGETAVTFVARSLCVGETAITFARSKCVFLRHCGRAKVSLVSCVPVNERAKAVAVSFGREIVLPAALCHRESAK